MTGERFRRFFEFFESRFAAFKEQLPIIEPEPVTDDILELVHSREYIKAIRTASEGVVLSDVYRYVSSDNLNPLTGDIPPGVEKGARIIAGVSLLAGELIAQGKFSKAVGIGGGMHLSLIHI